MAEIKITPVKTTTNGNYSAEITAIETNDEDCLIGTVDTPALGNIDAKWNKSGICRDKDDSANIAIKNPEVSDILETHAKLTFSRSSKF